MHSIKNIKLFKWISLILIISLLIIMSIVDINGKENNLIYFTEHKLFSEKTNLFSPIEEPLMPGDSKLEVLDIQNKSNKNIELFFKVEPLDNIKISDNIKLTIKYKNDIENKIIKEDFLSTYNEDFISLGEYKKSEVGIMYFELNIPNNLNNEYINKKLYIKWVFGTIEKEGQTSSESKEEIDNKYDKIQTGILDNNSDNHIVKICFFIFLILFILVMSIIKKPLLKYNKKHNIYLDMENGGDQNEKQKK